MLVLVKINMKTINIEHMENYTHCNNMEKAKPSTAMEVVGINYTEVGELNVPGVGEGSARAVKKLT